MANKSENLFWANNLRAFATFIVILLHLTAPILDQFQKIEAKYWWFGNILDGFSRFCVPIFLMLTGALILPKSYSLKEFLNKRLSRILMPFLFWSIIYTIYFYSKTISSSHEFNIETFILFAALKLKNGAAYHLWYIYAIIGIYLIFPIIQRWILNCSKHEVIYYLIIWLIANVVSFPLVNKYWPRVDLLYFSGFLGYTILGYYLTHLFNSKQTKLIANILIVSGASVTILGTYYITNNAGVFMPSFYNYLSLNVMVLSSGIFLLFKNLEIKSKTLTNGLAIISKYSFGIYLSHIFIIELLATLGIRWIFINPFIGIPFTTLLCLLFSLLITYLINKIPFGKYVSG